MATYTMRINELANYLCAEHAEDVVGMTYSQKLDYAAELIMPEDYPCYGVDLEEQDAMRSTLSKAIVRHYLMREIGYETYELWKIMLETRLREIMPYYQQLYETTLFKLDLENPYHMITEHDQTQKDDRDVQREGDRGITTQDSDDTTAKIVYGRVVNGTSSMNDERSESSQSTSHSSHSDFPQASYANGDYVSTADDATGNGSGSSEGTQNGTTSEKNSGEDNATNSTVRNGKNDEKWSDKSKDINDQIMHYLHDVKGHTNNLEILDAIEKWRELILNINQQIIEELKDLFIQLY